MAKLRVCCFSVSVDGFGAGPNQRLEHPMGEGGMALHTWVLGTKTFREMHGFHDVSKQGGGTTGVDDDFARRGMSNLGAWILGRHMFTPERGAWTDSAWKGWWGSNPPYHTPVFVLTHHARTPIEMEGGTTFHFVTGGIREAYDLAMQAAGGKDVRVGGGAQTVRQYLEAGLIDEMHLAVSPVVLGRGEPLFAGLDLAKLGYRVVESAQGEGAMHVVVGRT